MYMITYMDYNTTVQDDLLVRVIFDKFVCGKLIGEFYIGDFVPCAIEHAQLKQNGGFYIGDFCIEPPITNINSSPINGMVCLDPLILVAIDHVYF